MMSMQKPGKLFLLPSSLGESPISRVIPQYNQEIILHIRHFYVESEKSARQFLRKSGFKIDFSEVELILLNEHIIASKTDLSGLLKPLLEGYDGAILSDAGCPAVADPGAEIVKIAHQKHIQVIPLVGPSSILLALMASGMNGQGFTFLGYLPKEKNERIRKIKLAETDANQKKQTQIFIETPYRNQHVFNDILSVCKNDTLLCLALDISTNSESIVTKRVDEWKRQIPEIGKRQAVFLIY